MYFLFKRSIHMWLGTKDFFFNQLIVEGNLQSGHKSEQS